MGKRSSVKSRENADSPFVKTEKIHMSDIALFWNSGKTEKKRYFQGE